VFKKNNLFSDILPLEVTKKDNLLNHKDKYAMNKNLKVIN
jgi:hypothetical protein